MSWQAQSPVKSNIPEDGRIVLLCSGGNGADLTVVEGKWATVPRTGEGAYTLTFLANPGVFKGWRYAFGAATPADCAGYTAVRDTPVVWDGTSWTLSFIVYNSSFAAADLLVNQYIDIELAFGLDD